MIYFMQAIGGGPIKIGFTDDLERRKYQLECHYGKTLVVLGTRPGYQPEETEIFRQFQHLRIGRTEQFQPALELMEFIGCPTLASQAPVEMMAPVADLLSVKIPGDIVTAARVISGLENIPLTEVIAIACRDALRDWELKALGRRMREIDAVKPAALATES